MIPILMYHQIGVPAAKGTPYRGLTVHQRDFRRQMRWLQRLGYQGLSMARLMPYLQGQKTGRVVGITFDDGYQNVLDNTLEVLAECGFSATNYIVTRLLGGTNIWDADEGVPSSKLMDAQGLRQWVAAGHELGSHTLSHAALTRVSPEQARDEIYASRSQLEQLTGQAVQAFCYPYGKLNPSVVDLVRAAGYQNATTTQRGLARPDDDLLLLPRVAVMRSTNIISFMLKCATRIEDRRRA